MDVALPHVRSKMMSTIRGRDTKPELFLRKALHGLGFRYRLHAKHLPGRPDLMLPKWNAIIFVHGCFWHRHPGCRFTTTPATRPGFWQEKFEANVLRDARAEAALRAIGLRTAIVWECGLRRPETASETLDAVREWLLGTSDRFESRLVEPTQANG